MEESIFLLLYENLEKETDSEILTAGEKKKKKSFFRRIDKF